MLYKIVHRHHGQYAYYFDSEDEALEMMECLITSENDERTQYYIREI